MQDEATIQGLASVDHTPLPVSTTPISHRAIWWEVCAVLAIGVIPYFSSAITFLSASAPLKVSYWAESLHHVVGTICINFAVLYLIYRSGEPWSRFGIKVPNSFDLWFGALIVAVLYFLVLIAQTYLRIDNSSVTPIHMSRPSGAFDYFLMVVKHACNGFAEELVIRAYLITRLEKLFKSSVLAVFISALLFTSYHIYYGLDASLLIIFLMGMVFGALFVRFRRVWPLAIAHMLWNIFLELLMS